MNGNPEGSGGSAPCSTQPWPADPAAAAGRAGAEEALAAAARKILEIARAHLLPPG